MRRAACLSLVIAASAAACDALFPIHEGTQAADSGDAGGCARDCLGGACVNGACAPFVCGPTVAAGGYTNGIAVDGDYLFWSVQAPGDQGLLLRCPAAGCTAPTVVARGLRQPGLLALDARFVYLLETGTSTGTGRLRRCARDAPGGCESSPPLLDALDQPSAIALDGPSVYFTTGLHEAAGTIAGCALAACGASSTYATDQPHPSRVASGGGALYWTNASADGGFVALPLRADASPTTIGLHHYSSGLAVDVDAGELYWGDTSTLHYARLGGGLPAPKSGYISSTFAESIALDERRVYFIATSATGTTVSSLGRAFASDDRPTVLATAAPGEGGTPARPWAEIAVGEGLVYWTTGDENTVLCLAKPP